MTGVIQDFFIDFSRCIGCQACAAACAECHTHRGTPMIHVDLVDPGASLQTAPMVCMHCENPTCASVCPADAIKVDEDGIVHASLKPRCIACANCELACPFGVPMVKLGIAQMQKCDMCFDRTSDGKKPMCATVCPSGALFYGTRAEVEARRPQSHAINTWRFGEQEIKTRVFVMVPRGVDVMSVELPPMEDDGPAALAIALQARELAGGSIGRGAEPGSARPERAREEAEFL
jgi:Fe-S-cluster-containing dehydrogenase component